MPFSNQHPSGYGDLLSLDDTGPLRAVDEEPATLDRTILGIPNDHDEYNRGLTFFFDPSTGQPSVQSKSEEPEDPVETSPYEPSMSSNQTGSRIVYTPQSDSDVPAGLHSQVVSPQPVRSSDCGSSDGGSCHGTADRPHPPSVSACATFGTNTTSGSTASTMEGELLPGAESISSTTLSLAFNLPPEYPGPSEKMSLDQDDFNQDDFNYLECVMTKTNQEEVSQTKRTRMTRTPKSAGTRHDPMGTRVSTKPGMDREKAKMMRRIGVCLPCLVNHEPVSRLQKQPYNFSRDMLTFKVCPWTYLP